MCLKRTLLLLILFVLCLKSMAQQLYTAKWNNQSLVSVLPQLEQYYHIQFAYSSDQINLNQTISLSLNQAALEPALKKIFAQTGIAFSINGTQVLLYKDPNKTITISGYVKEKGTGELLAGVWIGTDPPKAGTITNNYGFYSLILPADTFIIRFKYVGFKPVELKVTGQSSQQVDITLESVSQMDEVVIRATTEEQQKSLRVVEVPLQEIKNVPVILGEKDVVKYMMLAPGVQKGNEGNSYMYVRGGGPDQNLVLIDDAPIYNAYHFLGLSSLFSGNELRRAELIKGGFSSKYGGRLSSVLDMSMKEGNREHLLGEATIGSITSKLQLEGPIIKNKSSFLVAARGSYITQISQLFAKTQDDELDYGYIDLHAKFSTDLGARDRLYLSGYFGRDQFASTPGVAAQDDGVKWSNRAATLRWNHQFSGKLFSNTSLVYSYYKNRFAGQSSDMSGAPAVSAVQSVINDYTLKTDFDYAYHTRVRFKAGAGFTLHHFNPLTSYQSTSQSFEVNDPYYANEAFVYGEAILQLTQKWNMIPGLRMSYFQNGPAFVRAEPRISSTYELGHQWTLNASYALMNQYVHLITSSGFGLPTDIWLSTNSNLKPQRSNQVTAGVFKRHLFVEGLSIGVEGFYKFMDHTVSLKDGSSFYQLLPLGNVMPSVSNWSDLLTQGNTTAYGGEIQLKREGRVWNAMVSYTLSKTEMLFESINRGNPYPATYDRRHDFGIYAALNLNKRFTFSANWVYGSGYAVTLPVGQYPAYLHDPTGGTYPMGTTYDYEGKNGFRMKPYHRLDISLQFHHGFNKKLKGTVEISVYNVYNRSNPMFYQISQKDGSNGQTTNVLTQVSLFPVIPSLSWTLKF